MFNHRSTTRSNQTKPEHIKPERAGAFRACAQPEKGLKPALMRLLLIAFAAALLPACAATQQQRDLIAYLSASCEQSGFTPGTPEHRGCMLSKIPQRTAETYAVQPQRPLNCSTFGAWTHCF